MSVLHDRRSLIAMALAIAALTSAGASAIGGTPAHTLGGIVYLSIAVAAVLQPGALTAQVVAGQLLAGSVLLAPEPPAPLVLLPLVAGVVATAELVALLHRTSTEFAAAKRGGLGRVAGASAIGAGVYVVVLVAGTLPGPGGIIAVALGAGACALLALHLATAR